MENIIYKVELENILRNKLNYNSGNYLNLNTSHSKKIKIFKTFFEKHITYDDDDELEISEIHKILQNNNESSITESLLEDLISHYTSYISEDGKTINNISVIYGPNNKKY